MIGGLPSDLRFTFRGLVRNPGFSAVAILTIALGIGATTAFVSVLEAMLLRPLPVAEPDRLRSIQEVRSRRISSGTEGMRMSFGRYLEYSEAAGDVFSGLAAHRLTLLPFRGDGPAVPASATLVSASYFPVLGLTPALGRFFESDSETAVVLHHRFWHQQFGADPGVLGRVVQVNGRPLTIVGVAPPGFGGTQVALYSEIWVPYAGVFGSEGGDQAVNWVGVVGRLRPGVDDRQAAAVVGTLARRIPVEEGSEVRGASVEPLLGMSPGDRTSLMSFLALVISGAAILLLIGAANVAGMLLSRAVARRREVAVRLALGAGAGRLVRQFLTESVVLFSLGGLAGIGIAFGATRLLARVPLPDAGPMDLRLQPDPRVLGLALLASAATGILFGLAPALNARRATMEQGLREGGRASGGGNRIRRVFVVSQITLAVVLLFAGGLVARTLQHAIRTDPGFDPANVTVARVTLTPERYDEERGRALLGQLVERIERLPGVESVARSQVPLVAGEALAISVRAEIGDGEEAEAVSAGYNAVDARYFETLRVDLVAGRPIEATDRPGAPLVVVVNETLARRLWPGESPLGKRLVGSGGAYEVVGVARDGKYTSFRDPAGASPFAFVSLDQVYAAQQVVHVRARPGMEGIEEAIRREVAVLDPDLALERVAPLAQLVGFTLFPQRAAGALVGIFALIGLVLAAIGVYGMLALDVAQRRREIGIRLALGATAQAVERLVVRRGASSLAVGAGVGLLLSLGVGQALRSLVFGISPMDPFTLVGVAALMTLAVLAASYLPARSASRVQPLTALRQD